MIHADLICPDCKKRGRGFWKKKRALLPRCWSCTRLKMMHFIYGEDDLESSEESSEMLKSNPPSFDEILGEIMRSGCDGDKHPKFNYRPYRRGHNRCHVCGGRRSYESLYVESIFTPIPTLRYLKSSDPRETGRGDE